jgi:hypothetical protein
MNARILRKIVLTLVMTIAAAPVFTAQAAEKQKAIRVEDGTGTQSTVTGSLKVDFKATKDVFAVDEPISFKIRSNKEVYVYVFNMDENQQKAVQIFPNKFDKANLLKPGKTVTMPSKKSVFRSDAVGTERLILIASEKKLNLQHSEPAEGSFYDMEWKSLDSKVKAIRVESGDNTPTPGNGKLIKELDIVIQSR